MNCQSLNAKFNEILLYVEFLRNAGVEFGAICLQETWFSPTTVKTLYDIPGYILISQSYSCSSHGGLAIYLKDNIKYRTLDFRTHAQWENQFVEINEPALNKKLIIGNIYRLPRGKNEDYRNFIDEFSNILHEFQNFHGELLIGGDFNIDLLKCKEKSWVTEFLEVVFANSLLPTISYPTRISQRSETLIDNFFYRFSERLTSCISGILSHCFSDHQPYFIGLRNMRADSVKSRRQTVQYRTYNNESISAFKRDLTIALDPRNNEFSGDDHNTDFDRFLNIVSDARDKNFPLTTCKFNKYKHKKTPWISLGLLKSIKHRDSLYRKLRLTSKLSPFFESRSLHLKNYNKALRRVISIAKKSYYTETLENCKNDHKKTWSTINSILQRKKESSELPMEFLINNSLVSDKNTISNEFNKFFTNIGLNLSSSVTTTGTKFQDYLGQPHDRVFMFKTVNERDILKIIDDLKTKTSSGYDGISTKLLKECKHELLGPLTRLINTSLTTGIFPDALKLARVLPLHKKGENTKFDNYRPISLLPTFSKIYERVIHSQLKDYFTSNKLFNISQYGFREKHSTELAAAELIDRIIKSLDSGKKSIAVFMDLSKAFDTIDHEILLYKLKHYGLADPALNLILSYMTGRKQYVDFNGYLSDRQFLSTGVPQGSILGPLLFIIYINDLSCASDIFNFILFADDTTAVSELDKFGDINDKRTLCVKVNNELNNISIWLKANKLSLNLIKTKYMIFQRPGRGEINLDIIIDNINIEQVDDFNFLGLTINKHLSWTKHVNNISLKIARVVGILKRLKQFMPIKTLTTIYHSLISPHLNYHLISWGYDHTEAFKLQKRAVRVISNSHFIAHTEPIFKEFKILALPDLHNLVQMKLLYKYFNNTLPHYFSYNMFKQNQNYHDHLTRNRKDLVVPFCRHNFAQLTPSYSIVNLFNRLPRIVTEKLFTHSQQGFIYYYKQFIFNNMYSSDCHIRDCFVCRLPN